MLVASSREFDPKSHGRSKITNGKWLPRGIDGRSPMARRFRDLVQQFSKEIAGEEPLSPADLALVKQTAGVIVRSESIQADIMRGVSINDDELVRLSNLSLRLLGRLQRLRQHQRKDKPYHVTVAEHFKQKATTP